MRNFRDAKAMAASLRKALQADGVAITAAQSREAIARAFGVESWPALDIQIESAKRPRAVGAPWKAGDAIVVRHVQDGKLWAADAAIVVEDRPTRLVIYRPLNGAMQASRVDWENGVFIGPNSQRRHSTDALTILTPGAGHAVTAMFHGGGGPFICWYVDLQEPFRRVPDGIVTCDQSLDIVAGLDRRWRWKDEDHLARSVELGWRTQAQAQAIRREGEKVVAALERGAAPFSGPWPSWKPDPSWPVPELPEGWDRIPAFG